MPLSIPLITDKNGNPTDIVSHLLKNRIIYLSGEINDITSELAITQMLYLDSLNHDPITMYVNSVGGECTQGLAIIDCMNLIKSDVNTVCIGEACSMGAVILSSGKKRFALPNSEIMIHQVLGGAGGQCTDIQITAKLIQKTKEKLTKMLAKNCKQTYEKVLEDCERDFWLDAEEALEYGIIDKILK